MENLKFFLQYLLSPIVIAIVGGIFTYNMQSEQRNLEKIKFTEQIIKDAFDAENPAKGLAIIKLIKPAIKSDPDYADSLIAMIVSFYNDKAREAARNGQTDQLKNISSAAENTGGAATEVAKEIKSANLIGKSQQATELEQRGFELLESGKVSEAKDTFKKAERVYPGFHNVYEISKLLENKEKVIKDNPEEINGVKKIISEKYSWKAPQRLK